MIKKKKKSTSVTERRSIFIHLRIVPSLPGAARSFWWTDSFHLARQRNVWLFKHETDKERNESGGRFCFCFSPMGSGWRWGNNPYLWRRAKGHVTTGESDSLTQETMSHVLTHLERSWSRSSWSARAGRWGRSGGRCFGWCSWPSSPAGGWVRRTAPCWSCPESSWWGFLKKRGKRRTFKSADGLSTAASERRLETATHQQTWSIKSVDPDGYHGEKQQFVTAVCKQSFVTV